MKNVFDACLVRTQDSGMLLSTSVCTVLVNIFLWSHIVAVGPVTK